MATDHFSELFENQRYHEGLRDVALHFYAAGRVFAQTEIRQKAIAEAARIDKEYDGEASIYSGALRTFAAGLIGLSKESE